MIYDPCIRGAEDVGVFCQLDLNTNMYNFIQNRYLTNNPQGLLYGNSLNFEPYSISQNFSKLTNIHSMLIYFEKKASHCMKWMKHDKKQIVGTSKGNLCVFNVNEFLDARRGGSVRLLKSNVHDCAICCLEFNHQGNKLLTGDKKGLIRFFKTKLDCVIPVNKL